jgi:hypothetical protein
MDKLKHVPPFALMLAAAIGSFAQSGAGLGSISGVVKDASGSVVPGAKVTIANDANGVRRTIASNDAGLFNAPALPPARGYRVTVELQGFSPFEQRDVDVQVGGNVDLSVTLAVAGAATQVEVASAAPLVEDTKTDVSHVVANTEIQELPINGRRYDSFVLLTPGVTNDGTFGLLTFRGVADGNSFLTDGNDTTNQFWSDAPGRNRLRAQISQDAVQEFQVLSAAYLPEFGRASGGVINTVTKSGTNALHGTFFWFFRNRTLNARDRYATFNPPETQHQTGASVGGPIRKDKLFYFLNTEIVRRHNPISASYMRPGVVDPSGHFLGCGSPATPAQCVAIDSILARQYQLVDRRADSEMFFAKIDWRPTERNSVSADMNYSRFLSPNGIQTGAVLTNGGAVGSNADSTVRVRYARLSWTAVPKGNIVNEARFGWFKDRQFDDLDLALTPPFGNLTLSVNGASNLGIATSYPRLNPSEQRFEYADNLSWIVGRHQMKFGIDVSNTQDVTDSIINRFGSYTYGTVTNFALDFSGNTSGTKNWQTFSQAFGNPRVDATIREWAFFAQDQFRVTPRLTLNYGLRYDYAQLPQPSISNPAYPQTARIPGFAGGWGPRAGLAYSFTDSKTVVRGGYGLFQARYFTGIINSFFLGNGVYQKSVSYSGNIASDKAAGPVWPSRLTASDKAPGTVSLTFAGPDFRPPYTLNGDVTVEHQFGRDSTLAVSYLYNRGKQLTTVRDLNIGPLGLPVTYTIKDTGATYTTPVYLTANRVDKNYSRVNQVENGGKSWYDGLAVDFHGRAVKDVQYRLSYTWSHEIDLGQGVGSDSANLFASAGPSLNNLFNGDYRQDKASGALDQRHRLSLDFVASHNFLKSNGPVAKYLINNWQLSGILTLASGRPTYATINIQSPVAGLPNTTLNGFGGDTRVPFWAMNPVNYDPAKKLDARITKNLPFSERYKLSLNFEAFNVTNSPYNTSINHTAYNASGTTLTPAPGFGDGTASAGFPDGTNVRRAQVSLRFVF